MNQNYTARKPNVQVLLILNKSMSSQQTVPDTKKFEQWPVQSRQPMNQSHAKEATPMVYADDTGQIIM